MATKILLDTDIGSDIDDAVCLAYLLAQPECELLGITTVTGNTRLRASLADALCRVAQKNVPIYPGAEQPLLIAQKQPEVPQAVALANWEHTTKFPQGEAISFLSRTIRENPHEIVLLGIGPLTNLALLFRADPEAARLLKGLVLMCGRFNIFPSARSLVEWNALCDPHAADIVYKARPAIHRSIGLDVTEQVRMDARQVEEKFTSPLLQAVRDFSQPWFQRHPIMTFHDPLAATTIFDPAICTFSPGLVEVELESRRLEGFTYWSETSTPAPHEVALQVDTNRFFDHYFGVFEK